MQSGENLGSALPLLERRCWIPGEAAAATLAAGAEVDVGTLLLGLFSQGKRCCCC